MKKFLLPLTALTLSAAVSACSWHEEADENTSSGDTSRREWEHKEHLRMMTESFFSEMDKNMDGYISRKEYNDYTRRWFREADMNHDGKLSYDEVKAQLKKDKEKMKADHFRNQNRISNNNDNDENNGSNDNDVNRRSDNSSNQKNQ